MVMYHERNLIINYIPKSITDAELTNLFSSVGTIKYCRIIRDRSNGSSFGFGFCEYEDSNSAHKAIVRFNGYRLADKILKVSLAKLHGRLCQSSNLYVKNLPLVLTEEDIFNEFGRYGNVIQCRVLRDHGSNISKGSAYVLFENLNDAESAKQALDGGIWPSSPESRRLSIKFATPPYRQASTSTRVCKNESSRRSAVNRNDTKKECHLNSTEYSHAHTKCPHSEPCVVNNFAQPLISGNLCTNLPHSVPTPVLPSSLPIQPQLNPHGMIWTPDFAISESQNAISTLNVAPAFITPYYCTTQPFPTFWSPLQPNNLSQFPLSAIYNNQLENYGSNIHGYPIITNIPNAVYPTVSQFRNYTTAKAPDYVNKLSDSSYLNRSKSARLDKDYCTSLYVYNIGNMNEAHIYVLFSQFGTVNSVSIPRDLKTNVPRNFGFVTFSSFQSAQNAVNVMNGFFFNGRHLQVSFRKHKSGHLGHATYSSQVTVKSDPNQISDISDSGHNSPQLSVDKADSSNSFSNGNLKVAESVEALKHLSLANRTSKEVSEASL